MKRYLNARIIMPIALLIYVAACQSSSKTSNAIPWAGPTNLPTYIGQPAVANEMPPVGAPQNPSLGLNPFNNVHNDTWMSDVYDSAGPLGRSPVIWTSTLTAARRSATSTSFICGTLTIDSKGRLIAPCLGPTEYSLVMLDPSTLEVLAFEHLPLPSGQASGYGSAYMYLDNQDRPYMNAATKVIRYRETSESGKNGFALDATYDLSDSIGNDSTIQSSIPAWSGLLWVVTRQGAVALLDPVTSKVGVLKLNEEIGNSTAVTEDAMYVATTKALYRISEANGTPVVVWRSDDYGNIGTVKPGQLTAGTGTTPTILGNGEYVAIADNAAQMHVNVYRTAAQLSPGQQRLVCEVPVFKAGAGADEDSLIGHGLSLIVVNTYGAICNLLASPPGCTPSEPGVARVDIRKDGSGCDLVWSNDTVVVPEVLPKMSSKTGLIYLFLEKFDAVNPEMPVWYWAGMDFRDGKVIWQSLVGTGQQFNGYVSAPALGPDGTMYLGEIGGVIAIRDSK